MATLNLPIDGEKPYGDKLRTAISSVNAEVEAATAAIEGRLSEAEIDTAIVTEVDARVKESTWEVQNVYTAADMPTAIAKIVAAGRGAIRIPHEVNLSYGSLTELPPEVRRVTVDGVLTQTADVNAFRRWGTYTSGNAAPLTVDLAAGQRVATVSTTSTIQPLDWVWIASEDTIPGTGITDKIGYMRQVRSVGLGQIGLDTAVPRTMTVANGATIRKINMAPSISFNGDGEIRFSDQNGSAAMLSFRWCLGVRIAKTLTLTNGGGYGVAMAHVVGFSVEATIKEFRNDPNNGFYGYGVAVTGSCRDGYVGGVISRCRHAFTTLTGPSGTGTVLAYCGEPENIVVAPLTFFCGDKALDTHRPGWGIKLICRDIGSGGGVHIRSDNTYAEVHVDGITGPALQVDGDGYAVAPVIGSVVATGVRAPVDSAALSLSANTKFLSFPQVQLVEGVMWRIVDGAIVAVPPEVTTVVKPDTQSVTNSTTLVDATGLSLPVIAGGVYLFSAYIIFSALDTADLALAFQAPTGSTISWTANGTAINASTNTYAAIERVHVTDIGGISSVGGIGSVTQLVALVQGTLTVGTSSGNLFMQFAQRVLQAGGPATVRAGSSMKLERIR